MSLSLNMISVNSKSVCCVLSEEVLKWLNMLRLMSNDVAMKQCRCQLIKKKFKELDLDILIKSKDSLKFND